MAQSFEGFRQALRPIWGAMLAVELPAVPEILFERAFARQEEFPVINSWLGCQLHLAFLSWRAPDRPSQRRLDDYRHIIESNGADLFVSGDAELLELYPTLNCFREAVSENEFAQSLSATAAP